MEKYGVIPQAYAPLAQGRAKEMFEEPAIKDLCEKYHKSGAQIALRFLIQSGISAVPKSIHTERIQENLAIFDFELTQEEMAKLAFLDKDEPLIGPPDKAQKAEFLIDRPW